MSSFLSFNNQRVKPDAGATVAAPLYTGKKRSLMFVCSSSVVWGNGLDHTETFAAIMQRKIDATVGQTLGGWVPRNIHTDDWQSSLYASGFSGAHCSSFVYPTTPSPTAPFDTPMNSNNLIAGYGTGDGSQVSGFSSGATPPLGHWLNPTVPTAYTVQGSSKLNFDSVGGTNPAYIPSGIFGYYGIAVGNGPTAPNCDSQLLFNSSGQNFRGAAFFGTSNNTIGLGLTGNGSVNLFAVDSGGSTVLNTSTGVPTGAVPLSTTNLTGMDIAFVPFFNAAAGLGSFSVQWNTGKVQISTLAPFSANQKSNHILTQISARNSYCLQDYIRSDGTPIYDSNYIFASSSASFAIGDQYHDDNNNTYLAIRAASGSSVIYLNAIDHTVQPPTSGSLHRDTGGGTTPITYTFWVGGTGQPLTTLIKQSVLNSPANAGIDLPIYIIGDTFNSMYTRGSWTATPGDASTSGSYAFTLLAIAKALGASSLYGAGFSGDTNAGRVILVMPWIPPGSSTLAFPAVQYQQAIAKLCSTYGFSFIDLSGLPSLSDTGYATDGAFCFKDGTHPSSPYYDTGGTAGFGGGAQKIANAYIQALGL